MWPDHLDYLAVLAGCVLITLPLELVLGARVWRRPALFARALAPVAAAYLVWDLWGILRGTWWYEARYITGVHFGPVPLEEVLFFVVVPLCAVLTLEAVGNCLTWAGRLRARRAGVGESGGEGPGAGGAGGAGRGGSDA